jgi:nucleoside-diphosphate-sugar epimerase
MISHGATHGFRTILHAKSGGIEGGDLANRENVTEVLTRHSPDVIMHFAGRVPLASRHITENEFINSNAGTTEALVDVASSLRQKPHIILPSSAAVYPPGGVVCDFKTASLNVIYARTSDAMPSAALKSPYAKSKALSEEILRTYTGNWTILRKPTVIGKNDRRGNFLQLVALSILEKKELPTDRLERCSDYIGIEDVFRATMASASNSNSYHQVMNVGSGQATTGHMVWAAMLKAATLKGRDVSFAAPPESGIKVGAFAGTILDIEDTKRLIQYEPQTSISHLCGVVWGDVLRRNSPQKYLRALFPNF